MQKEVSTGNGKQNESPYEMRGGTNPQNQHG